MSMSISHKSLSLFILITLSAKGNAIIPESKEVLANAIDFLIFCVLITDKKAPPKMMNTFRK